MRFGEYICSRFPRVNTDSVEPPRNLPRQLNVRHLVLADRDDVRLVDQNIRRLQHGITEKPVSAQVFFLDVFLLLFVRRDALQPARAE